MYTEMFKSFSEQTEKTLAPYAKFNKVFAKNVEQLTELQLSAVRAYSDLGLNQLKAVSEVKDIESLTAFNGQQLETLTKLSQQLLEDSNKFSSVAQGFKTEVEEFVAQNVKQATPAI
ncbi:phasin family protein [Photobacterium phosphoreum]|uniref:Phasin family protein n=1 Tax=Photobacterium phosphoreum TaxID=659 RepID=A0A2T3JVR8_PHOPO|nr:phasin family protein [Photobacterium phosphoreum]PSU26906.1 phasin family protein [Photobacterium phosphoreum]PSU44317.1 phasin family protein [Photobacterium phosphoreum]PSU53435.1 phasin family protein [Photobacterium phosphoreum]